MMPTNGFKIDYWTSADGLSRVSDLLCMDP